MSRRVILTAAPEFEEAALAEIHRTVAGFRHKDRTARKCAGGQSVWEGSVGTSRTLAPGVRLVELPVSFGELAAAMRRQPPIFIRHIQPVEREVSLTGVAEDLDRLADAGLSLATVLDPGRSFSVQTRQAETQTPGPAAPAPYGRFEVNERLASALKETSGAPLDVRAPEQVLSVMITPETGYLGLSNVEENLSAWAGGAMRFAREPDQVSRSEFKLLEALRAFHLTLPAAGKALDLGASPGGWTRLIRRAGLEVTAVDPGDLDPRVGADPGVHHVRATAQEYRCGPGEFAVIVNDMRMDARDSARLMLEYAACLDPDGFAVMTLKLPHRQPEQVVHQAMGLLLRRYERLGARQLFHNRSEITVALQRRRKDGGRAAAVEQAGNPDRPSKGEA